MTDEAFETWRMFTTTAASTAACHCTRTTTISPAGRSRSGSKPVSTPTTPTTSRRPPMPAADDPTDTEEYREEEAEIKRQTEESELYPLTDRHPFPPSHYDKS